MIFETEGKGGLALAVLGLAVVVVSTTACEDSADVLASNQPPSVDTFQVDNLPTTAADRELDNIPVLTFTATASDVDGSIASFAFLPDDGSTAIPPTTVDGATATFSYQYTSCGVFRPTVLVTDDRGLVTSGQLGSSFEVLDVNGSSCSGDVTFGGTIYPLLSSGVCSTCHFVGYPGGTDGLIFAGRSSTNVHDQLTEIVPTTELIRDAYVDRTTPTNAGDVEGTSLILRKVRGLNAHTGGAVLDTGSSEYQSLVEWVEDGAPEN